MDLKEFLNSENIALYINKLPAESTLDSVLFPDEKQLSMEIEQAEAEDERVQVLKVSQFDVAAKKRALNASVDIKKHEMPFFKESIGINEKTRRDIIQAKNSGNQTIIEHLMKKVFDNYANLVDGGINQMRRMRAQVIQFGAINLVTNEGDVVVDFNIPTNQKITLSSDKKWNVASADIIGDILKWQKIFVKAGRKKPTRLIMTEETFENTIMINTAIKNDMANRMIAVTPTSNLIITQIEFLNYLKSRFGLSVAFVDGSFINEEGESQNFYEDGRISFIPEGTLGKSKYSFTPEEYDKIYGSKKIDTSVVKTAIAITTMVNEDPVTVDTKVSMIGMPQLDNPKGMLIAKVY